MKEELSYVGIDVAKARVDVAVRPNGDIWSNDYNEAGIEGLVVRLQTLGPAAVVLEAMGGLEVPLASALAAGSLPVAVVNPRQVRDFAKATGRLAKTDALDAQGRKPRSHLSGLDWTRKSIGAVQCVEREPEPVGPAQ